ncbi:MAG TPA: phospholipid-binding protein [Hyphomonas atlantica]|uniref:Phospholipid-binding protein n=1 Tax=Hyphomonas atlantica TaxID=1280948 RepID=A0A356W3K4_9PROT|nr:phospholipid-binding protein [Hyphomonas atlantica]|tara:strand:- start:1254 stop:1937 length:684 start_codon:yes stop_codon:yes gene_type:complete
MRTQFAAAALVLAMPLCGCAAAALGTAGAVGVAAVQDKSLGEAVDDATASNQIKSKLLSESANRFGEVDVEVTSGLVLLSGRVDTPEDRVKAEGIAWTSPLTRDVANEIRIEPAGGFLANVSDELITARVRSRLVGSSSVKSVNFNIETYNGVVYLMGIARSAEELKRAAEEASVVGGVKQVVSYVRVRDGRSQQAAPTLQGGASYQSAPDASYDTSADGELIGASY